MLMSACSSPSPSTTNSPTATDFSGQTLNILFASAFQVNEKDYILNTYLPKFESQYGVKVNADFETQADGITKIGAEQQSGKIVNDILYVDTANMAPYVSGGWMSDISSVVNSAGVTVTTNYDSQMTTGGQRWFVPNSFDVYLLIANKKALPYLPDGLTQADVEKGITWDQYADWANAIAAGEGKGMTMFPANMTGSQLLYPLGGIGLAYGATFPDFSSDAMKQAWGIVAKMAQGNAFYSEQAQYTAPSDPLSAGDVWLTFAHMGPVGTAYNASPNDYVIGTAPTGSKGAGSTSGAWSWGIQKGAPDEALAEQFIKFALTPAVNYDFCSQMGGLLSPIAEVQSLMTSDDVIMAAGSKMITGANLAGVPSTDYSDWNAVKLLYGQVFDQILTTKAVPSDADLQNFQTQLQALKK